ncbi:MAG: hypothetical protein ACYDCK_10200 [Thermoplasmatota archaeon]
MRAALFVVLMLSLGFVALVAPAEPVAATGPTVCVHDLCNACTSSVDNLVTCVENDVPP